MLTDFKQQKKHSYHNFIRYKKNKETEVRKHLSIVLPDFSQQKELIKDQGRLFDAFLHVRDLVSDKPKQANKFYSNSLAIKKYLKSSYPNPAQGRHHISKTYNYSIQTFFITSNSCLQKSLTQTCYSIRLKLGS